MADEQPLPDFDFDTRAVRAGTLRSPFNEHSEALFLTSSFVFDNAAQAAERFSGADDGYVYSRFTNPTVRMFEQRLASLEGAEDCIATASGMAAITATCLAILKSGDHVVCGANVFGATLQLYSGVLARFGIDVSYVDASRPEAWRAAVTSHSAALLRDAVESADGNRRHCRICGAGARDWRAQRGRQLLLHPGAATAARVRRRR
jgi:O-succinylhomoserine sulfhydrylase